MDDTPNSLRLEEAQFLWDEYRYRHEHCWSLIFKVTAGVIAILIIPYAQPEVTKSVGIAIVFLPAVAVGLVVLAWIRFGKEIDLLNKVKTAHRLRQATVQPISYGVGCSTFKRDVRRYLLSLAALAVAEMANLVYTYRTSMFGP